MWHGSVRELWRYPVKSMRGERLAVASISVRGLAWDRGWALLDVATGKIASAKHPRLWGGLLQCQAQVMDADGTLRITLPDGSALLTSQDVVDQALSEWVGRSVRLLSEPPAAPEIERYWPDVDGLALRDTTTSGQIGLGAPSGTFFDYAPLHVVTTATLARLRALHPGGQIDARRFRPNLVIELPDATEGFVENGWVGQSIQVGPEVRLRVTNPTPRCVVPTLPQAELEGDIEVLRTVARHNRPPVPALDDARLPCLGIYAAVERAGVIRAGDAVRPDR